MMSSLEPWEKLSSKTVFRNREYYYITCDKVKLPNGKIVDYIPMHTNGSVAIVPLTKRNTIIFLRQYRYTTNLLSLEIPIGGIKKKQKPLSSARAELQEEIGYTSKHLKKIGAFTPCNGIVIETCHVYIATQLTKTVQRPDETEFIEPIEIPVRDAFHSLYRESMIDGMTLASLGLARKYIRDL